MRPSTLLLAALVAALGATAGCAGASPSPAPGPSPASGSGQTAAGGPAPMAAAVWPTRTRPHVDLWLHAHALLVPDTTLVPYFDRGYRERIGAVRRTRGVTSLLDTNRDRLLARLTVQPALATSGQFVPMYFESWDSMKQAIDLFTRGGGNVNTQDPTLRAYIGLLGSVYQSAADREWLRLFTEAVDSENRNFHDAYWTAETRSRAGAIAYADSMWQRQWRPAMQRFLNNTQQQNGEVYLSLPLGGEGRTIHFNKSENAIAVPMPATRDDAERVLYVIAHEATGAAASAAIEDNTTPAERRAGTTSRYEQAAAVRAGALLLERTIPSAVPGYMRFYLRTAGRTPPTDPRAMFTSVFTLPAGVADALSRQFDSVLGGI